MQRKIELRIANFMGKMKTPIEHYHAQGYKYEYPRARKELNKDSG